jgi:hypothetical protein
MRSVTLLLLAATCTWAQLPLSVGLKAGYVNNKQPGSEIFPLKGGPYLELSLPLLPTFETGLMFERYNAGTLSGTVYQIPILLKKRMNFIAVKPFFSGGATIRRIPSLQSNQLGATFAGGITLGLLPIKIEPEIRYTRWLQSDYSPNNQQTEFLIGIRF